MSNIKEMKIYSLEGIAKDVRIAIDRNGASAALKDLGDVDTLTIDEIIMSKVVEAVKRVHSIAPAHLLDGGYFFGDSIHWPDENPGCGWVSLPDDFMRFISFKMDDWARGVFTCMSTDDVEYEKQSLPFKGVRGTPLSPKCFISIRPEGRIMEFYSSKNNSAKVSFANYLPYPKIENNSVRICEKCYDGVVYTIAGLVMATVGDVDKSNVFNELAKSALV